MCGATGEQHSLSVKEKIVILNAIQENNALSPDLEIILGVSSIRQKGSIELAKYMNQCNKISGVLLGYSPYILPTQKEAIYYTKAIVKELNKPII